MEETERRNHEKTKWTGQGEEMEEALRGQRGSGWPRGTKTTERNPASREVSGEPLPGASGDLGEGWVSLPQVSSSRYSLRQAGSGSCCTAWGRKRRPSERRTA